MLIMAATPSTQGPIRLKFSTDFNAHVRKEARPPWKTRRDPECAATSSSRPPSNLPPRAVPSTPARCSTNACSPSAALAKYKQYDAVDTLFYIFAKKDEDVGLHFRADEALQVSTGKHLPDDPKVWKTCWKAATPSPAIRTGSHARSASPVSTRVRRRPSNAYRKNACRTRGTSPPTSPPPATPGFFTRLTSWTKKDQPTPTPPNQP